MGEIVDLRGAVLTDVPTMLRHLADAIEAGEHGDVHTCFAVIPVADEYPKIFGWGLNCSQAECGWTLHMAQHWLAGTLTRRK